MTSVAPAPEREAVDSRLRYIPALDGIRALAVLSVMTYHFGQSWLSGGFIGVDVFFVLSGFLITTLLVERAPARPSLVRFWIRRGRRLFPALALMLVVVFVFASTTGALEQATIRGQGLATLFYVNNWWLLHTGMSYFDSYTAPSPLLHTWSLSVEEQWYLVFPLLLMLLAVLRRFRLRIVAGVFALLALASIVWTSVLASNGASADRLYLSTDTRAQQLLIGALLGVLGVAWARKDGSRLGPVGTRSAAIAGGIGALGLVVMCFTWQERSGIPAQLLLSSIFSVLLIMGALSPVGRLPAFLAWEPLRRIGVISYGLYLWHWPLTVMVSSENTSVPTIVRLVLTFSAAGLSYVLVERPVRRWSLRKTAVLLAALPLPLIAVMLIATPKAGEAETLKALPQYASPDYRGEGVKAFFVGDSVGGSLWQQAWLNPRTDMAVTGSLLLGCPPMNLDFVLADGGATELGPPPGTTCGAWQEQWRRDVARLQPDVLVYVLSAQLQFDVRDGGGQVPFGSDAYREKVFKTLDTSLRDVNVRHVVISSPPCTALGSNAINDAKNDRSRHAFVRQMLWDYAHERGYGFLDLAAFTCVKDPSGFYIDGIHFSEDQARNVWNWMAPQIVGQIPAEERPVAEVEKQ